MFTKPTALYTIGLDLEGSVLKGVQLSQKRGKAELDGIFEITLNTQSTETNTENVNPLYSDADAKILQEALKKHLIVTTLPSAETIVRTLDLKLKKESDIDSVLTFQAEPLLPYPIENAMLDRIIVGQNEEGSQVTLLAARKDHIQQHLGQWEVLKIEPEIISSVPFVLALFSKKFSATPDLHFVLHLGKVESACILVKNGKLIAAQTCHTGINDLIQAYGADNGNPENLREIDFSILSEQELPHLYTAFDAWRLEVTRLIYSLSKQLKEESASEVLLTGEGALFKNLGAALCQTAQKKILLPLENPQFALPLEDLQRYAIPIGAALSGLPKATDQINFRQQDLTHSDPWKRLKKPLAIYFASCFALAIAIYLFGLAYAGYKEDQAREDYVQLITAMNKSYDTVEKEYAAKMHIKLADSVPPVKSLTLEDIGGRLQLLQKDLKDSPDAFPLQPNIPRVSDVLAWLSTHPNVALGKDPTGAQLSQLQIDNFTYTIIKRPEIKKPTEKYQVKVEMEFSTATPKLAREFHDALIAPNDLVDPKGEIKWSSNKSKYKTSFFLKDRTSYASLKSGN